MSNTTTGNTNCIISPIRRKRFQIQGYDRFTDSELYDYRLGLRFAYFLCGSLVLLGMIFENLWILSSAFIIAFFGSFLLRHPFDYLYNYAIRYLIHKPVLPFRTVQGRFACGIATVWTAIIIYFFYSGHISLGFIAGGILILLAVLVSIFDICIPSMIYNFLFRRT